MVDADVTRARPDAVRTIVPFKNNDGTGARYTALAKTLREPFVDVDLPYQRDMVEIGGLARLTQLVARGA